jgi:hypothetical protein
MTSSRASVFFLFSVGLAAFGALGQSATGAVNGTVTDRTGGVVPGATVWLMNQETGIESRATAGSGGYFVFPSLKPGIYVLRAEMQDFKTTQTAAFGLAVNQTLTQDISLELGAHAETVEVTARTEMLQRSSSELGTVIEEKAVHDLPLNGRNFTQLLSLTPGAIPVSTSQNASLGVEGSVGIPGSSFVDASIQGQQNRSKIYFYDGIINTNTRGPTYVVLPSVDLIEEFKVQSHNDKAEYGGVTGGVINIVSRTGGNRFRGSAYGFVRDDAFDARNPLTDLETVGGLRVAKPPADYSQRQFGATLSGPIVKNKTFFSIGYDGWRYRKPTQTLARVPTEAELNGDFSQLGRTLYNPYTTRRDASGNLIRDPFPGNRIPASLISGPMQGFLRTYMPKPNLSGDPFFNFIQDRPSTNDANLWQARIDHRFSARDNVWARYTEQRVETLTPVGDRARIRSSGVGRNYGGGWLHAFSPQLALDVRGGVASRPSGVEEVVHSAGLEPMEQLGFRDVDRFGGLLLNLTQPWNEAGIGTNLGQRGPGERRNPNWSFTSDLSWQRGSHSFKLGFQYIQIKRGQFNTFQRFDFDTNVTADPQQLGTTGDSLASALLGLPVAFRGAVPGEGIEFKASTWAAYVQDEWRLGPKLTLTWGLRYDYLGTPTPLGNTLQAGPDLDTGLWLIGADTLPACNQSGKAPCIPGNGAQDVPFGGFIAFTGKTRFIPKAIKDNVGPRMGIGWQLDDQTVLRAGSGLHWDTLVARSQYAQHNVEKDWVWPQTQGFFGTANGLGQPPTPIQAIQGSFPGILPAASPWNASGWFNDPDRKNGYSFQWNVEIQRQMTHDLLVSAAYVGSTNGRLEYSGLGNTAKTPGPGSPEEVNARRPVPHMGGGVFYSRSIGDQRYNALQVKIHRRFAAGFQSLLSYTWSKCTGNTSGWFAVEDGPGAVQNYHDPDSNRGPCSYDVPHFLSWATVWDLPVGKGKRWLTSGPAAWILGNWQLNAILQARSGQPFTPTVAGDVANIGSDVPWWNYARPNLVGDPRAGAGTAERWFNPDAYAIPQFSYGNAGVNSLRSDGVFNVDLSLFKTVPLRGTGQIQLRFEAFNVFNTIDLGIPGSVIGQGDAGRVTTLAHPPRELQFGLRLVF